VFIQLDADTKNLLTRQKTSLDITRTISYHKIMNIIYVRNSSGKKKPSNSKKLEAIRREHQKFLESVGYTGRARLCTTKPKFVVQSAPEPYSTKSLQEMVGPCPKRDIWERTRNESNEVKEAIRQKAARTAPAYSKGALQYITDGDDLKTLGRKTV